MSNYRVISPSLEYGGDFYNPRELHHCVVLVEAKSKREAMKKAIKTPEMKDWVSVQRRDGCNPFTGLRAELEEEAR